MTNAPDRSILRCYSIFNIFVFLFGDGPAANQLGKIAVRAAGDYAIRSLAAHSRQAEQLIFAGRVYIERLVAIPSFSYALSQRLRVLLDV